MFTLQAIEGSVKPGAFQPDSVKIGGQFDCPGGPPLGPIPIEIDITNGPTASGSTSVITLGGVRLHVVTFDFQAWGGLTCGQTIQFRIRGDCSGGQGQWGPWETHIGTLECHGCPRSNFTVSYGACTGTPPNQTQLVTLTATVMLAPSETNTFTWTFGDGTSAPAGSITNTGGWSTPHTLTASHSYAANGSYTASLSSPSADCPVIRHPVTPKCGAATCPTVTVTHSTPGSCVNGKRDVTFNATVVAVGTGPVIVQWDFPNSLTPSTTAFPAAGAIPPVTVSYDASGVSPASRTASLRTIYPSGCPDATVMFTIDPCPATPCCPDSVTVTATAPSAGVATLKAVTNWPAGCQPLAPTYYDWTVTERARPQNVYTRQAPPNSTNANDPGECTIDTSAGWYRPGSSLAGAITLSPGKYDVVAKPTFIGALMTCPPRSDSTDFDAPGTPPICPQLTRIDVQPDPRDPCTFTFTAHYTNPGNIQGLIFHWSFHDGGASSSASNMTAHAYAPGTTATGDATVTLKAPGCPDVSLSVPVTHCCVCPTVSLTASGGSPPTTLTASAAWPAGCPSVQPTAFDWETTDIGSGQTHKQTTVAPSTSTSTGWTPSLSPSASGSYDFKVTTSGYAGAKLPQGCNLSAGTSYRPPSTSSSTLCDVLLWIALILMFIGGLVAVVGCILYHFFPQAGLIVGIVGVAIFATGALLFLAWWIFCRFLTACAVILAVRDFVIAMIALFGVITAVLVVVALVTQVPSWWGCVATSAIESGLWGGVLAMLDFIAIQRRCLIPNPSGIPPPPDSSSSGLSSDGERGKKSDSRRGTHAPAQDTAAAKAASLAVSTNRREAPEAAAPAAKRIGLGDVVSGAARAIGVQPCEGCGKRARALNALASVEIKRQGQG